MKFIAGFLSSLLGALILSSCLSVVLHRTILNTRYLQHKIEQTNLTATLSQQLPQLMSQQAGKDGDPKKIQSAATTVLTPAVLQSTISTALDQMNNYLNHNGALPELDVKDIARQARAQGLDIPQELGDKPLVLPAATGEQFKKAYKISNQVDQISFLATGVLFLLLFLICVKIKNYRFLVILFFSSAAFQFSLFIIVHYAPTLITRYLPTGDASTRQLQTALEAFGWSVLGDMGKWFISLALVFAAFGLLIFGLSLISGARHKKPA